MPKTISLAAYAVKIWDPEERKSQPMSSFDGEHDFMAFLYGVLSSLKKTWSRDKNSQQVLRVKTLKQTGRATFGIIETGEYGVESTLLDVEKEVEVHARKATEANMLPFYFLLDVPDEMDEAILLLQRTGMYGIRHLFSHVLCGEFDRKFTDYRLKIHPIVDKEEIEKYQRGRIESIRFISFKIPPDITDALEGGHKETFGRAELIIYARRGRYLPINRRLNQFFSGARKLSQLVALDETNFKYDDIKVKSKVGGSSRTVDLRELKRLRSYYDVSGQVQLDSSSGHPKFASIHEAAQALRDKIAKTIYGQAHE
ncbi:MAG TPA: hypothetical protein VKB26_09625 [Candidatus Acidoferrales bacterium]|nr:hypothetical protein [Candidatus Acidoferrales bacterium]